MFSSKVVYSNMQLTTMELFQEDPYFEKGKSYKKVTIFLTDSANFVQEMS